MSVGIVNFFINGGEENFDRMSAQQFEIWRVFVDALFYSLKDCAAFLAGKNLQAKKKNRGEFYE